MASEPPFAERPDDRAADEGIQPIPPDLFQSFPAAHQHLEGIIQPSAMPPSFEGNLGLPFAPFPPPRPQPGFWLAVLATLFMYIVTQVAIPLIVIVLLLIAHSSTPADFWNRFSALGTKEGMTDFQNQNAAYLLVSAHVPIFLLGLIGLRILAGRRWYREIALRLPSFKHFVLLLLGYPALPILAGGAYWLAQKFVPGLGELPALFFSQLVMIGLLSAIWLTAWVQRGRDPKVELARSPIQRQLVIGLVLAVVALATARGSFLLLSRVFPVMPMLAQMDQGMEDLVLEIRHWPPWLAVLVIAVMPAFSEEIWCRAFLGRGLVGQYGIVCGVLITSYFFGAIHLLPHQGAMALLMGVVLHYSYITTRSLLAPMLLHFLNNATSVLGPSLGPVAENIDTAPDQVSLVTYGCALLLMAAVAYALYQTRTRLVRVEGPPSLPPWQPAYPGVALPPPDSGTVVSHAWLSAATVVLVVMAFGAFATVFALSTLGYAIP